MRIAFRTDASFDIGTGHVMRCINLAAQMRNRGFNPEFICCNLPGNLNQFLRGEGFTVFELPATHLDRKYCDPKEWVKADLLYTSEVLASGDSVDWLVIDHYQVNLEWERGVRKHTRKIMVIDDFSDKMHDCDVLLNQNYSEIGENFYASRVPRGCVLLLGPRYALLSPEYASRRSSLRVHSGLVRRLLVFFGGSDLFNMAGMTLRLLMEPQFRRLEVDIVVGANSSNYDELTKLAAGRRGITIHKSLPHLADLMLKADLAIGAAGITAWERLCLGLPSIVVDLAKNQIQSSEALYRSGLVYHAGDVAQLSKRKLQGVLTSALSNSANLQKICTTGQLLVDGKGSLRCLEVLLPTPPRHLFVRQTLDTDILDYFNWANDPAVRKQAFNSLEIPFDEHQNWFHLQLETQGNHLFILQANSLPVGQIRFNRRGDKYFIDYSLDSFVRGRGWSKILVLMGISMLPDDSIICAEVKNNNAASCAVFKSLGFHETHEFGSNVIIYSLIPDKNSLVNCWMKSIESFNEAK